ncbi:MAG: DUF58 domain-containing protein [Thermoanaerobaculia bacterium]
MARPALAPTPPIAPKTAPAEGDVGARSGGDAGGARSTLRERFESLQERRGRRGIPEGIRITKVGLWFVLLTVVVAAAATNTGNNALYLVLACMLALLLVSGVVSRLNLQRLTVTVDSPGDLFARRPFHLPFTITNDSRRWSRWLLLFSVAVKGPARLVPHLPAGKSARGHLELLLPKRGRHRIEFAHFSSLFPIGLFRKGMRYRLGLELLVFPELFAAGAIEIQPSGLAGDESANRAGWGHELHALRSYRAGDDPRAIHWKKSAQTGALVFMERASEESRRLSIVFDNATGRLADAAAENRFEHLVSEAATAAVDHLARGFEVELISREGTLAYGTGGRHRQAILEQLAVIGPRPRQRAELASADPATRSLRLSFKADRA